MQCKNGNQRAVLLFVAELSTAIVRFRIDFDRRQFATAIGGIIAVIGVIFGDIVGGVCVIVVAMF